MPSPVLEVEGVSKRFAGLRLMRPPFSKLPDVDALDGVTFAVMPGKVTAIIGQNGSGKTTLLRILAGILYPSAGKIHRADGNAFTYVSSQDRQFYDRLTGYENLRFFVRLGGAELEAIPRAANSAGVSADLLDRQVWTYSSGQRRRLALARAFLTEADVYLLDEPARSLDADASDRMLHLFFAIASEGKSVLMATHDREAVRRCENVIKLADGRVVFDGSSEQCAEIDRRGRE